MKSFKNHLEESKQVYKKYISDGGAIYKSGYKKDKIVGYTTMEYVANAKTQNDAFLVQDTSGKKHAIPRNLVFKWRKEHAKELKASREKMKELRALSSLHPNVFRGSDTY